MDKHAADKMIKQYYRILYGFALSKAYTMDEAEELASRIVLEVYVALLKVDDIYNWDGYIYRIAWNVYARYVKEIKSNHNLTIHDLEIASEVDFTKEIERSEEYRILRREVSWLSKIQRNIVYMHYFKGKKISEISLKLDIPEGTVKWHLHDAKKSMREGIKEMRTSGDLGIQPICFCHMGHDGYTNERGDTSDYLNTKLRQNIAYAAYYDAKTIEEIASELGVSPVYIEDEVELLEEYGFMDKLSGSKYRTNILIDNIPMTVNYEINIIHKEIAKIICNEYVPLLMNKFTDYQKLGIYIPNNDINYLLYSLVTMSIDGQYWGSTFNNSNILEGTHYRVKRKDGGEYIASASIVNHEKEQDTHNTHYDTCGAMTRGSALYPISSWQISTDFDAREFGFSDNLTTDFENLYLFMNGKLDKNEGTIDKYYRLYKRGLIVPKNGKDEVNVVLVEVHEDGNVRNAWNNEFHKQLPCYPDSMIQSIKEITHMIYEIQKQYYPKHMHKLVQYYSSQSMNKIMVLDELIERGILKDLTVDQKKGVMTLVFTDVLPGEVDILQ